MNQRPVLIVGAGPTGLVLALWLTRLGIRVRIVDKVAEPGTTSRALAVQARTLEFYRQIGLADTLVELKGICHCGRKATMNLRVDADGNAVAEGASVEIGGNDRYISLCRRHFMDKLAEGSGEQLRLALTRAAAAVAEAAE